jgi:hypothetical protein
MFNWLKKNRMDSAAKALNRLDLIFKDSAAAVDYASDFMVCEIASGVPLPAEVLHANAIMENANSQTVLLRVCGSNGGFKSVSTTLLVPEPLLAKGDFVSWIPEEHIGKLWDSDDHRSGWVGLVVAELIPRYEDGNWGLKRMLLKAQN